MQTVTEWCEGAGEQPVDVTTAPDIKLNPWNHLTGSGGKGHCGRCGREVGLRLLDGALSRHGKPREQEG